MKEGRKQTMMLEMRGYPTTFQYADGSGPVRVGDMVCVPTEPDKWAIVRTRYTRHGKLYFYATISRGSTVTYIRMKEIAAAGFRKWSKPRRANQRVVVAEKPKIGEVKTGTQYIMGLIDYDNAIIVRT